MSKTHDTLLANKSSKGGSLVGYFPVGYPTLQKSVDAAIAMCKSGVDVLELGVPYSDPVMDGPVIQDATVEALENGFKLHQLFDAIRAITSQVSTPLLVMTYWNPVMQYGVRKFAEDLKASGAAGLITPDLIPDEAAEWLTISEELELDRVFLSTPTSSPERVSNAVLKSLGFVYCVSTMGITGTRDDLDSIARKVVSGVKTADQGQMACVGIGISTAEQVSEVVTYSDGAIVGSAFVKAYQRSGLDGLVEKVSELRVR